VPTAGLAAFRLAEGAIANSAEVVAARNRLLAGLEEDGYALANVGDPIADADDEALALDVTFKVNAGPQGGYRRDLHRGIAGRQ
jgi:outer membrane protein assembly factor BamA